MEAPIRFDVLSEMDSKAERILLKQTPPQLCPATIGSDSVYLRRRQCVRHLVSETYDSVCLSTGSAECRPAFDMPHCHMCYHLPETTLTSPLALRRSQSNFERKRFVHKTGHADGFLISTPHGRTITKYYRHNNVRKYFVDSPQPRLPILVSVDPPHLRRCDEESSPPAASLDVINLMISTITPTTTAPNRITILQRIGANGRIL